MVNAYVQPFPFHKHASEITSNSATAGVNSLAQPPSLLVHHSPLLCWECLITLYAGPIPWLLSSPPYVSFYVAARGEEGNGIL